ncbi:hypothetical protein BKA62DRAFT_685859 [Auriculariales sp. MPI-PUGE-AT-0066]|nr:hypothetical protein BKA62DRAFT_685859 [Auriculariales sp. MPI-PUGE-AT-0066]
MADDTRGALDALTGFDLSGVLEELGESSSGLDQMNLGFGRGSNALSRKQIYKDNDNSDDDADVVHMDTGRDWEVEVDQELERDEPQPFAPMRPLSAPQQPAPPPQGTKRKKTIIVRRPVERQKSVYELYPDFEHNGVLQFTKLFRTAPAYKSRLSDARNFQVETTNARRRTQPVNFLKNVVGDAKRQSENKRVEQVVAAGNVDDDLRRALQQRSNKTSSVEARTSKLTNSQDRAYDLGRSVAIATNALLESGMWTQAIMWDPKAAYRDWTTFDFEDELLEAENDAHDVARPKKKTKQDGPARDKFNLSNDHNYELSKNTGARARVRQTFGQLVVHHALPALKLQIPFYKTRMLKNEMRSFHRPALQFPVNVQLQLGRVRNLKKKKDSQGRKISKGGDAVDAVRTTSDLSLRDTSQFVLLEYSEEHPPVMSNYGMGSILVNYYRKKSETDDYIPKQQDYGEPFLLDPQDESPFMKFGNVESGKTVPALYNNLIKAPLFRHTAYPTDFLIVRSTKSGQAQYFIREIKSNIFVVGQTYPVKEVPGPHSRKITTTVKNRLQIIAFKLLRKSPGERLKISRLMKYFPDQNELQMRQRLKEFMEYHRRGPHQGFWRLKGGAQIPPESEILKMLTPEDIVLNESMNVGQRHLTDLGYSRGTEAEDGDDSKLDIEQQLAPWITTKNFINATQGKAMLKLHGEGDPSGRGEAFSFIRVSMKEIFVKAGEDYEQKMAEADNRPKSAHRYNVAEQQQIYRSEIDRIWKAQYDSLSSKVEPELSEEDEEPAKETKVRFSSSRPDGLPPTPGPSASAMSPGYAPSPTAASPPHHAPSVASSPGPFSRETSMEVEEPNLMADLNSSKVLIIKRFKDGEWQTEVVRDQVVINAYQKKRVAIEEAEMQTDQLAPTGDTDRDNRAKKKLFEELARMRKNQERRLIRKNAKLAAEGGLPLGVKRAKPDTTRRCGNCGQIGHMKTNRKCPRWAEFNQPQPAGAPPPVPAIPSAPSPNKAASTGGGSTPVFAPPAAFRSQSFSTAVPSPLATSPPMSGAADEPIDLVEEAPSGTAPPKIKLKLNRQ